MKAGVLFYLMGVLAFTVRAVGMGNMDTAGWIAGFGLTMLGLAAMFVSYLDGALDTPRK